MHRLRTNNEETQKRLTLVTYKGKLLLICRDEIKTTPSVPVWGLPSLRNVNDLFVKKVEVKDVGPNIDSLYLKDEQVNHLIRKEGWRFEFYKISELPKLELNKATKAVLSNLQEKIANLISA